MVLGMNGGRFEEDIGGKNKRCLTVTGDQDAAEPVRPALRTFKLIPSKGFYYKNDSEN